MEHVGNNTDERMYLDVVDRRTGEICTETSLDPGERLNIQHITEKQDLYSKLPTKDFNRKEPFTKMYCGAFSMLMDKLTYAEINFFMGLCRYIGYSDCILRTSPDNRSKKIDGRKQLADVLGVTQAACYKHVASLEKKEILKIRKDGTHRYFVLNPFICFRGNDLDVDTFLEFCSTQWAKCSLDASEDR